MTVDRDAQHDPAEVRRLFGHWATGVTVVTSRGDDGPRGCTANAVTSLSLDPPAMLVCFELSSNTLAAVRRSGRFAVNMLAADQEALSRHFAGKGDSAAKFGSVPHHDEEGMPVLDGALAWMVCEVREEMQGGDHAIVIGDLLRGDAREDAEPLLFFRSRYHLLRPPEAA